ncbi:AAA family ATPase [Sulfurimonas sp. HSL-3221]|uniref:AAA family ATPase n=1 Tax=Sulfurimonadaceae TaxID=2771471 RepID=UPI001E29D0BC|nr:AAA family ATPase [Sulfurimonas sp. HSL-3221]UFS61312.1 AAA family ATPase [Sulfurimonas sp. HSL-3221]
MIEHFHLRDCLTFEEVSIDLKPGLIVFSGPSGSGKSVFMRSILASFGLDDPIAALSESVVSWQIDESASGLLNESPNVLREVKKEKARYFFNSQSISRATVAELSKTHLRHLSLKDYSDFDSDALLGLIDATVSVSDAKHTHHVSLYHQGYLRLKQLEQELERLKSDERKLREQEEFARFEVNKINDIGPEPGEYDALLEIKKSLSKKEKLEEKIGHAQQIFDYEHIVNEVLESLDIDGAFFDDTMNELRTQFDSAQERFDDLEGTDIEQVLNRLESLSELKRRYGSIEEALSYRDSKQKELDVYESLEEHVEALQQELNTLYTSLTQSAAQISLARSGALYTLNDSINGYLHQLYLDGAEVTLTHGDFGPQGQDRASLQLKGAPLQQISAGEFNRLRLALLAVKSEGMQGQQGVLMLDEIDANLSGEESMSVARVLRTLSRHFQILVISHQPQLTAMGEQHFIVTKSEHSHVRELATQEERMEEIARIVSGESVSEKARHLATELLETAHGSAERGVS